jgi:hypothetical protein
MAVYIVQGKLGTGKGKYVVQKMREALRDGKRVATNVDLWLDNLLPEASRATVVRVPDKPTADDLDAAGHGNPDSYDEEKNGLLVLDELGSWLNTRSFQDKHRAGILDWFIHARKKGWDCYLIVQSLDMVDKQVRVGVAEYLVKCVRLDKVRIPVIGRVLGKKGTLPRFHIANITLSDVPGVKIDSEYYRADDVHSAYDTRQIFRDWVRDPVNPAFHSETYVGPFSYLSPWHLKGRFAKPAAAARRWWFQTQSKVVNELKPKFALIQNLASLPKDAAWIHARALTMAGVI